MADVPGPRGLQLLGSGHRVPAGGLHAVAEEWCERYGPIFRFRLANRIVLG